MIRLRHIVSLALAVLVPVLANAQGNTGTITGTAREEGSMRPIPNARVTVVGTSISVPTRDDGTFIIRGAPTGTQDIRVLALGHAAQKLSVNVPADGAVSVDFALAATAIQLEQVVTTATGEQRTAMRFIVHPAYNRRPNDNDVALIELATPPP